MKKRKFICVRTVYAENLGAAHAELKEAVKQYGPVEAFQVKETFVVDAPEKVIEYLRTELEDANSECIVVFGLNIKNEVVVMDTVAKGGYNSILCTPADIFSMLLKNNARNLIIAHNHPSGDPAPSEEDLTFTKKIKKSASILGMKLLDHIIVVKNENYFSFQANKLL